MYIFISFHIVTITRRVTFFSPKVSIITNVILILYNSSINKKLIWRDLRFRQHISCFCSISKNKNHSKQSHSIVLHLWATLQWFVPEWINCLNDSVQSHDSLINSDLLPPAGDFNFTFKVPFHFFNIFKRQLSLFCLKYQNIIYLCVTVSAIRNKISAQ